jgi:hypothetical protein
VTGAGTQSTDSIQSAVTSLEIEIYMRNWRFKEIYFIIHLICFMVSRFIVNLEMLNKNI